MAWRSKRKVMHAYNITADIYDGRYSLEQHHKYIKALENIGVLNAVVLDVGCGSGLFFDEVTDKASLAIGVDISKKLLKKATRRVAKNMHVIQADADHLPFREGTFDASFTFTVLQNMPKPVKTLAEIKRVTCQGGKIAVTGLKKAFPQTTFYDLIEASGMRNSVFIDEEVLNCYIAILMV